MAKFPIISLNAGKLTPLVDARSDTEKFGSGCRDLDNMIPRIYGPVERRPGTKFIALTDDPNVKSRLVPFIFSSEIAYLAEYADETINMYFGDTLIEEGITSPYVEEDLFQLQFNQSADVMWNVHGSNNPRKLSRVSVSEFTLDKIPFTNGPFRKRNDLLNSDDVTIAVTGYTVATATLGAVGAGEFTITSTTDISTQFPVNHRFYATDSTGNDGAYTVLTATYATGTLTIVPNEAVATSDNDGQIMVDDATVTLTASSETFVLGADGHIDSLWKLTHKRQEVVTQGTATATGIIGKAIDVKGSWTFTTTGNWAGTVEIQRLADGTNWETFRSYVSTITGGKGSRNVQKSDIEDEDGIQYRMFMTSFDSGSLTADFVVDSSTQDSIFKITAMTSTTSATATALVAAPESSVTKRWAEGSWSHVRGWPSSITFFEERSIYGFNNEKKQDIWLSGTAVKATGFEDFDAGVNDDDSFALTVPTANTGRWLSAMESLAVGMAGDEWRIRSSALDQPLTPTDFSIKRQTKHGSAAIQAIAVNEAIIFVDSVARKIREYTFSDPKQKFVSPDLTALAEDITSGGITSMAVQSNPDSIIWFTITNSPYLISMTYEREQNVVAFSNHPLGGNGIAESVAVTPGTNEDVITLTVKRTINGSTVRTIEQMQPRDWGDDTDIFFVDAGVIDTSGSTIITGLGHLEGEEVSVMVDGALQSSKTVSGGQVTIDTSGDRAVVGLPYTYQVSPMLLDTNTQAGTTHAVIKTIPKIGVSFFKTLNARYGNGIKQFDINWRTEENYDSPPDLFTGDKLLEMPGGFTTEDRLVISGSDPFPCTVRAIIPRISITGQ